MPELPDHLTARIDRLAADRESGASRILAEALAILRDAVAGAPRLAAARALVAAQPSMAPVWNAALEALASESHPGRLDRFTQRVSRSAGALARFATACLGQEGGRVLHLVTISSSRSVEIVCETLRLHRTVRVSCSDSRPALEGRALASRLARLGIGVTIFGDAAIAHALADADALVLGADAVAPQGFLNKIGSGMAAAAAAQYGVPLYVAATRDKFAGDAVAARLAIREGAPAEVWEAPPPGVDVRNPYFEWTPLDLVTGVISDLGVLGAGMIPAVCRSSEDAVTVEALGRLVAS